MVEMMGFEPMSKRVPIGLSRLSNANSIPITLLVAQPIGGDNRFHGAVLSLAIAGAK